MRPSNTCNWRSPTLTSPCRNTCWHLHPSTSSTFTSECVPPFFALPPFRQDQGAAAPVKLSPWGALSILNMTWSITVGWEDTRMNNELKAQGTQTNTCMFIRFLFNPEGVSSQKWSHSKAEISRVTSQLNILNNFWFLSLQCDENFQRTSEAIFWHKSKQLHLFFCTIDFCWFTVLSSPGQVWWLLQWKGFTNYEWKLDSCAWLYPYFIYL